MLSFIVFIIIVLLFISWNDEQQRKNKHEKTNAENIETAEFYDFGEEHCYLRTYEGDLSQLRSIDYETDGGLVKLYVLKEMDIDNEVYIAFVIAKSRKIVFYRCANVDTVKEEGLLIDDIKSAKEYHKVLDVFDELLEEDTFEKEKVIRKLNPIEEKELQIQKEMRKDINFGGKFYTFNQFASTFCGGNQEEAITLRDRLIKEGQAEYYNKCIPAAVSIANNRQKQNSKIKQQPQNMHNKTLIGSNEASVKDIIENASFCDFNKIRCYLMEYEGSMSKLEKIKMDIQGIKVEFRRLKSFAVDEYKATYVALVVEKSRKIIFYKFPYEYDGIKDEDTPLFTGISSSKEYNRVLEVFDMADDELNDNEVIYLVFKDSDNEVACKVLDIFYVDEVEYIAIIPQDEEDVSIYRYSEDKEGIQLYEIETEEEYAKVADEFDKLFFAEDDKTEENEDKSEELLVIGHGDKKLRVTKMVSELHEFVRIKGRFLLRREIEENSDLKNGYEDFELFEMISAIMGVIDATLNDESIDNEIHRSFVQTKGVVIELYIRIAEQIRKNNGRYFDKYKTLQLVKKELGGYLDLILLTSEQDFLSAWDYIEKITKQKQLKENSNSSTSQWQSNPYGDNCEFDEDNAHYQDVL